MTNKHNANYTTNEPVRPNVGRGARDELARGMRVRTGARAGWVDMNGPRKLSTSTIVHVTGDFS